MPKRMGRSVVAGGQDPTQVRPGSDGAALRTPETVGTLHPNPKLRFLDQCREVIRFRQLSLRTGEVYVDWIRRFIVWNGRRHPREMGWTRCGRS